MFSLGVPPFPSFLIEVVFFIIVLSQWCYAWVALIFFGVLGLVYNLNWLMSLTSTKPNQNTLSMGGYGYVPNLIFGVGVLSTVLISVLLF